MAGMSIKVKVLSTTCALLLLAAGGLVGFQTTTYKHQIAKVTDDSIHLAIRGFEGMAANDVRTLSVTADAVLAYSDVKPAFEAKDKDRLIAVTQPLFEAFKKDYAITNWNFSQADGKMFMRLMDLKKFGDQVNWPTAVQCREKKTRATGFALGQFGFALRVTSPVFGEDGSLVGCMEMGTEVGRLLEEMKRQTNNEYGLAILKEKLDPAKWENGRKYLNLPNNWEDQKDIVLGANTSTDEKIFAYDGDIKALPEDGRAIGLLHEGAQTWSRGVFPVADASGTRVGAMFVLSDVSGVVGQMETMQRTTSALIAGLMVVLSGVLVFMLNHWVFKRLQSMIRTATRVAGGDFDSAITPSAQDEIGQFEVLFEQFRQLFVGVLRELEAKNK